MNVLARKPEEPRGPSLFDGVPSRTTRALVI